MKYSIIISLLSVLFLSCQEPATKPIEYKSVSGQFNKGNEIINAGENITVSGIIGAESNHKSKAQLILHHSLYTKTYALEIIDQSFEYEIPGKDNQLIGEVLCRLAYQGQVLSEKTIFINPLAAVDKIQNFNGPKSLFANDDDGSMNVSIPHDKFENPLLPPSKVNYQSTYNGVIQNKKEKEVEHLIAYQINPSKKKNGKYLIGTSINEGYSQEQELIIGAVLPINFSIELISQYPYADARQYIHLKTSVMTDSWDNIVADGTMINFNIKEAGQLAGSYQAFSIGGIANVYIENPSKEVEWSISASLHDQLTSNEIILSFLKNVNDFGISWDKEKAKLMIGPVIGVLGQLTPDGTEVRIASKEKGLEDFIYLEEGKIQYTLAFDWLQQEPTQLEILIGGLEKIIDIE